MLNPKIFKAYDVRATYPDMLNAEAAYAIGFATAQYLKSQPTNVKRADTMVVGRDMRPSSPELAASLYDGIRAAGLNVIDVGMIDTSFVYFAINHLDTLGGIQTTASHNPIQYNGFKISGAKAKPVGSNSGLDEIQRIAMGVSRRSAAIGKYETQDLWPDYKKHVRQFLDLKRPLKVVIDASNGMAGKMVPPLFGDAPNLKIIPILFEITGSFTHDPNPLVEKNLDLLKNKMRSIDCDLGVCFDGDADRCMFLDENAHVLGCDLVTALLARDFLTQPQNRGATIVYDLRSSHVVPDEVTAAGGIPRRDRVGHAFLKKTLAETQAVFGGELSGHFYFRDNFFADSGAIAFCRVLSVLSAQKQSLSQLMRPLHKYSQSGEINFEVPDKEAKIRELADKYKSGKIDYLDGITVDLGDWWFNVRQSNTEPLLRLNLETSSPAALKQRLAELQVMLGEPVHGH
jgi:phosphomannomutase